MVEQQNPQNSNQDQNSEIAMHNLNILIIEHLTKAGLNSAASTLHVSNHRYIFHTYMSLARSEWSDVAEIAALK